MSQGEGAESHPLRLLDQSTSLPEAELSVILARSGVGKSAALINFAIDAIQRGQQVLHYCSGMSSERVHQYYQEIFNHHEHDKADAPYDSWESLYYRFLVISYLDPDKMIADFDGETQTLLQSTKVDPGLIIVDGLDYSENTAASLNELKDAAAKYKVRILASIRIHRTDDGTINVDDPVMAASSVTDHIYFMEPAKGRINIEFLKNGSTRELPIYFCPHDLVFRPV